MTISTCSRALRGGALIAAISLGAVALSASGASAQWRRHGGGWGPGAGLAAGVLGFAAGAAIANGISHNGDGHEAACYRAYRSYDARTDTYLGYDGYRHTCEL